MILNWRFNPDIIIGEQLENTIAMKIKYFIIPF
jgi:hypothetical protein